jgi:hypothetical protein
MTSPVETLDERRNNYVAHASDPLVHADVGMETRPLEDVVPEVCFQRM